MRRAIRGAALAAGSVCVCLALALAALALYGGASATTAAPPGPGPRAEDPERAVSSPVESSPELPSVADSGGLGSGALAGSSAVAESGGQQPDSDEGTATEEGRTQPTDAKPEGTEQPETGSADLAAERIDESGAREDSEQSSSEEAEEEPGADGAPEPESREQPPEDPGREPRGEGGKAASAEAAHASDSSGEGSGEESASGPSLGSSEDVAPTPRAAEVEVPEDKTMRLTIPAMARVQGTEVINAAFDSRSALDESALHPEGTGFPWEKQANVYIAGHRLGYPGTNSFLIFRDLNTLTPGDAVFLTDAKGRQYRYEVFEKEVVDPDRTAVMDEREGENIVTLQTCTLPDYSQRLIVRAAKVQG